MQGLAYESASISCGCRAQELSLPLNARRATACRGRRAACPLAFVPIKELRRRRASVTRVCCGVGRTPQPPQYNSYHLRQPAAPRVAHNRGRTAGRVNRGSDGGAARQAPARRPREEIRCSDLQDAPTRENEGLGVSSGLAKPSEGRTTREKQDDQATPRGKSAYIATGKPGHGLLKARERKASHGSRGP